MPEDTTSHSWFCVL